MVAYPFLPFFGDPRAPESDSFSDFSLSLSLSLCLSLSLSLSLSLCPSISVYFSLVKYISDLAHHPLNLCLDSSYFSVNTSNHINPIFVYLLMGRLSCASHVQNFYTGSGHLVIEHEFMLAKA